MKYFHMNQLKSCLKKTQVLIVAPMVNLWIWGRVGQIRVVVLVRGMEQKGWGQATQMDLRTVLPILSPSLEGRATLLTRPRTK